MNKAVMLALLSLIAIAGCDVGQGGDRSSAGTTARADGNAPRATTSPDTRTAKPGTGSGRPTKATSSSRRSGGATSPGPSRGPARLVSCGPNAPDRGCVTGTGFAPGERVELERPCPLPPARCTTVVTADSDGRFDNIYLSSPYGRITVVATGLTSGARAETTYLVEET